LAKTIKLTEDVLAVLSTAELEGNVLKLTSGQLDRKMYKATNDVLEAMGGKWNRKAKGHTFDTDPTDKLEEVLLNGEVTNERKGNGYFPTPPKLVARLIELAEIKPGMTVLEPSAGQGHIADELVKIECTLYLVEILPENRTVLESKGYRLAGDDFLKFTGAFDRIVMNPPFEKQADIDHVLHAYSLLKQGGRLVSVMGAGVAFRENRKTKDFRELVEANGWSERNPEGSFKESGTMVNTITVVLDKR